MLTRDYNLSIGAKFKDRVTRELYPIQSFPVTFLTTANYDKLLLRKSEFDANNLERSKKGEAQLIDTNPLCKSEMIVEQYAKIKDKQFGNFFTPHPEKDKGNLLFQNI